jgi:hypothetical protein
MADKCQHPNKTWGSWQDATSSVTTQIEVRDQTCNDCGKIVNWETRQK